MNDFEELAHRSSDAIRSTIDTDPIPDFRGPANRSRIAMLLAAVVLLAGVSAAFWLRDGSDAVVETNVDPDVGEVEGETTSAPDPGDFRLLWPVEDYAIESLASFPLGGPSPVAHTALYGSGSAEVPYADRDLLLMSWVDTSGTGGGFSGEEIIVRGGVGYRDDSMRELGLADAVAFYEEDIAVLVASRTLAFDDLVATANGLTFDGHRALSPLSSLTPLAEIDGGATAPGFSSLSPWLAVFTDNAFARGAVLNGYPATPDALLLERYILGAGASTPVRGTDGWLLPGRVGDLPGTSSLMWSEGGNVLRLVGVGLDPRDVAEDLESVDRQTWDSMVTDVEARVAAASQRENAGEVVLEGETAVATGVVSWAALLEPGSSVCLRIDGAEGASTGCSSHGLATRFIDDHIVVTRPSTWGFAGTAAPEVASISVEWADGRVEQLALANVATIDRQVFAGLVEVTDDVDLVAYDGAGAELARQHYPATTGPD